MSRYLKLVNFELHRFMKIYLVLMGITIASQITGVIVKAKEYLHRADEMMYVELMPQARFLNEYGTFSISKISSTLWFMGPIALCAVSLMIYVFFIWYRDWLGKNTFIYRLLMLPTSRINVYLAKATSMFLMVLGLIAAQLLLLPVLNKILQWLVPSDFRMDMSINKIIETSQYLEILIPKSFMEFMIYYGIGFMAVFVLFTIILFERSYRWKGIIFGVIYAVLGIVIFILPLLVHYFVLNEFFYPLELLALELVTGLVVIAGSIWTGNFLLKNKIRV